MSIKVTKIAPMTIFPDLVIYPSHSLLLIFWDVLLTPFATLLQSPIPYSVKLFFIANILDLSKIIVIFLVKNCISSIEDSITS